jgi:hypothetical protein
MNKNQRIPGKSTLKLNRETLRALTREQMEHANGGSVTIPTLTCSAAGCAGSNNSCINGTCHEN